ncbi:hypothetical protein BJX63DRAFT_77051 [Aspergillus granulosus]|uniref:Uncharacterized protein n=1 Tax=Aspergillus granulosus TaxID=176169 RepID=A0ABR4GW55_9EURO
MKSFYIDINIPGRLPQQVNSATEFLESCILGFDMVRRVAEYLEIIRPHTRTLDIVVRIIRIRTYPVAIISRFINVVLHCFSNLWSMRQLKINLAITSIKDSLFDVLEGPLHTVEETFQHDASTLQNTLKELRTKIARHRSQTPLSPDKHPPEKPMMRSVLYHLEAVIQVLCHPLYFSFIRQEANKLKEAHTSAIIAEHKRDLNKFRDAYSQISYVLDSYMRTQGALARIISQQVQNKLRELNPTDADSAEIE